MTHEQLMAGDLHLHSSQSDGSMSANELLELISKISPAQPKLISITDHNAFSIYQVARRDNLLAIPGIELSATEGDINIHLTAYFKEIDLINPLSEYLDQIVAGYMLRARKIYEKIIQNDYKMPAFDSIRPSHLPEPVYVNNIFSAFSKANGQSAFEQARKNNIFFVKEENFLPKIKDIINCVHSMNGLVFWAHPGTRFLLTNDDPYEKVLRLLISYGIDGIEAYYPKHTTEQTSRLISDASMHNLLVSGGSDFHGTYGSAKNPWLVLAQEHCKAILSHLSVSMN